MSIVRQLIQIAMVEAVRGRTYAGDDVFDSRMDTLDNLLQGQRRPLLIFSIEEAEQEAVVQSENGFLGRGARLTAMVQAAVVSGREIRDGQDMIVRPYVGDTDAAYEGVLNLLDRQWRQALHWHDNPWAMLFRELVLSIDMIRDTRATDPDTGSKHAARFTQFHLDVVPDPLPGADLPGCIGDGLALLEGDGDAGYAQIAADWRALLTVGQDWPDWRKLQSALFLTRPEMGALGQGPVSEKEEDFAVAVLNVNGQAFEALPDDS